VRRRQRSDPQKPGRKCLENNEGKKNRMKPMSNTRKNGQLSTTATMELNNVCIALECVSTKKVTNI
jgi:hypothetical protein